MLSPSGEEAEVAGYKEVGNGQVMWNAVTAAAMIKEIELTGEQAGIVRKALQDASDKGLLHEMLVSVWDALEMG